MQFTNENLFLFRYEFLRKLNMLLPAYTTICSRISNLQFFSCIQAVMDWMQARLKNLNSFEKVCALALDEVQIVKAYQYGSG